MEQRNNLFLNEKKSGIVPFQSRMGKDQCTIELFSTKTTVNKKSGKIKTIKIPKIQFFNGFPVLNKYKYLGLWMDYRLNLEHQMSHILTQSKANPIGKHSLELQE